MPRGDEVWVLQALSSSNPAISVDSKYVLKAGLNDVPDTLLAVLPQVTFVGAFKLQNSVGDQVGRQRIVNIHTRTHIQTKQNESQTHNTLS